jgi:two-component system, OmpR family, sensor kinase
VIEEPEHEYNELLLWVWGHNLRNATAQIRDRVHLIKFYLAEPSPNLSAVSSQLDNINRISEEIETTMPSPLDIEQASLNDLIKERVVQWETRGPDCPLIFQIDLDSSQPIVQTNIAWLEHILDILIENAVEATSESESKCIRITTLADEKWVTIAVKDTGKGIDQKLFPDLFRRPLTSQPGRGRGLYIARLTTRIYGGTVEVASTGPTGTTMQILLPLSQEEGGDA